jgi:hypothetical protein
MASPCDGKSQTIAIQPNATAQTAGEWPPYAERRNRHFEGGRMSRQDSQNAPSQTHGEVSEYVPHN